MKPSEDLFHLIRSLSQGEKWYFKQYTSKHVNRSEKKYVQLFEAIDKQKAYNESALRKYTPRLAAAKSYLYYLILESLEAYHAGNTPARKLRRIISQIEILYGKNLLSQARKHLRRAEKLADSSELPLEAISLIAIKQQVATDLTPLKDLRTTLLSIGKEEQQLIESYKSTMGYIRLMLLMTTEQHLSGNPRNKNDLRKFERIFDDPLLMTKPKVQTRAAKVHFLVLKGAEQWIRGDLSQACAYYKELLSVMESTPPSARKSKEGYLSAYTSHLTQYLSMAGELRRYDTYFKKKLNELRALANDPGLSKALRANIFLYTCMLELNRCTNIGEYAKGETVIKELEKKLAAYELIEGDFGILGHIHLLVCLLYMDLQQYETALTWLSKLQSGNYMSGAESVLLKSKVMGLLIHFELGHTQLLESHIRSLYRYLAKRDRPFKSERLMLHFIRRELPRISDSKTLNRALRKLLASLSAFKDDPFEKGDSAHQLLSDWIESHLQGCSMGEIVRKKERLLAKG